MPRQETSDGGATSLKARRQRLFDLHSFLRSVDNLRPDEALDGIARLFELWGRTGSLDGVSARTDLGLSEAALHGAIERLEPILRGTRPGHGGDLFQELVDVGVRAGMGQYFTPPPVAEAMTAYLRPEPGEAWLDPFCGSGLLLGSVATRAAGDVHLFGIDRDARVLDIARVEALMQHPASEPKLLQANALEDAESLLGRLGAPPEGVDGIVANPPFGAELHEADRHRYGAFDLAKSAKTSLETLGLEQCIRMLRPEGRLGIVLPQSILSNRSLTYVREFVLERCRVDGVLSLPGESFQPFKGVGKASVLFLTKVEPTEGSRIWLGVPRSIGWDSVGRAKGESDVVEVAQAMVGEVAGGQVHSAVQGPELSRNLTAEWLSRPTVDGRPLSELCESIFVGTTPPRAAYEEGCEGRNSYRMLKVADLTNHGVDWTPGERSIARLSRPRGTDRLIRMGDLALTAAAHHPRYIAAKVDYIDCLPDGFEARCLPVAEVLVLRPRPDAIDPILLLLWLRSDEGRAAVQSCITGQTAHLSPKDVAEVVMPHRVLEADARSAIEDLRESLRLRRLAEAAAESATHSFELAKGDRPVAAGARSDTAGG